jgi:hypothetical protein
MSGSYDTAMDDGSHDTAMDDGCTMGADAASASDATGADNRGSFRRTQGHEAREEANTDQSLLHGTVPWVEVEMG